MIQISRNSQNLDLYPDTKITFNLVSPLFSLEVGYNSHSFAFQIPGSPHNRVQLDFPGLASTAPSEPVLWDFIIGGARLYKALLKVKNVDPITGDIDIALMVEAASMIAAMRDMKLAEIDLGGRRELSSATAMGGVWRISQDTPGTDAAIELNGIVYSTTWGVGDNEEDVLDALAVAIQVDTANNGCTASQSGTGATAELTIDAIGTGPSATFYATTDIPANAHTWLRQSYTSSLQETMDLLVSHAKDVAGDPPGDHDYVFCPVKNEQFYAGNNADYLDYMNLYDQVLNEFVDNNSTNAETHRNTFVPFPNARYVIQQALDALSLSYSSSFLDSADFKKLYLYNNVSLDEENIDDDGDPTTAGAVNWSRYYWDLAEHVQPDLSPADLIGAIARIFAIAVKVNDQAGTIDFLQRKDALSGNEKDWREKTLFPYQVNYPEQVNKNAYAYKKDELDSLYDDGQTFASIENGSDAKKIEVAYAPLFENTLPDPINSQSWKVPQIKQVGETPLFDVESPGFTTRFMIFHGLVNDINGDPYPFASHSDTDVAGNSINSFSLKWTGIMGVHEKFHKPWDDLIEKGKYLSLLQQLGLTDLLTLEWTDAYRVRVREGEARGILRQVQVTFTMDGIEPALAEMYPI